ncbi:MAG: hypothetical protein K2P58_05845 [Hyphomonadaceae bacterium]|nr:hypothetical protein [Hyphomonadaceae bacterium]
MSNLQRARIGAFLKGSIIAVAAGAAAFAWLYWAGPYRVVTLDRRALAAAAPEVLEDGSGARISTREAWQARRRAITDALEAEIYGPLPADVRARVVGRALIAPENAGGIAGVEQIEIEAGESVRFPLILIMPQSGAPAPVIVMQNFCGNQAAFPGRPRAIAPPRSAYPIPCRSNFFDPLHRAVFGEWMLGPPFDRITARGYALAMFYGGDVVPDDARDAPPALAALDAEGAIAAWAWTQARAVDVLEGDGRIDQDRIIAWGQSRFGKVALLASALDSRIDAVIALQSGRGGDALTAHRAGESVSAITSAYPYWFAPRFRDYALRDPPVDQHELLALIAPRPLLIVQAARDGWADPAGAYQAVVGARPAFDLEGGPPPHFALRAGTHAITDEDWRLTLDFLDDQLR